MISADFLRHLSGKHIVVMGLGLHGGGLATTRWLLRHGAHVVVTDLRTARVLAPTLQKLKKRKNCTFVLGRHRHSDFLRADGIVANPGVPRTSPYLVAARKKGIPIFNEATIFFLLCPGTIIGITGTKGKSTVSTLIARCCKEKYPHSILAGNIRTTAMLDILDSLRPQSLVVLELSSWQLEGLQKIKRSPHIAVVTNLLDDHLNQYTSREAYYRAKDNVWKFQTQRDAVVLNKDNAPSRKRAARVPSKRFWFSLSAFDEQNGAYRKDGTLWFRVDGREEKLLRESDVRLLGEHSIANVLCAAATARVVGVPARLIRRAVRSFTGVPGRLSFVRTLHGVTYINDTTATAPVGTIAALKSFSKKVILIAGGVNKKLPYTELARIIRSRVKKLILLPGSGTDALQRQLGHFPRVCAGTMSEAVTCAQECAQRGDVVLLSPAAASFNLFLHEFDRGDQFIHCVRLLR